jgi:hypothetical protein
MKLKENYVSILIVLVAVGASVLIFYFKGWRGRGEPVSSPTPVGLNKTLPEDFPREFLADKDAGLVATETRDSRTTAIFLSKLMPNELAEKFVSSVTAGGWDIVFEQEDGNSSRVSARYLREGSFSGPTVEFTAGKFPNDYTEVIVKYVR